MALDGGDMRPTAVSRRLWFLCAFLAVSLCSGGAFAQDELALDVQTFHPAAGPYSIFTVESSRTLGHLEPTGSVILDYASAPLVLESLDDGEDIAVVDQQLAMHVLAGVGFFDLAQLDVEIPVYFVNDSELSDNIEGGVIGDMAIRSKVTILSRETYPIGLAGGLDVTLPTGREESLVGDANVEAAPQAIVDYQYENILVAANLGIRVQEDSTVRNIDVGERFEYGVGAEASFLKGLLRIGGELYGRTELSDPFGSGSESPLEGLLGAKIATRSGFSIIAGAGGGLIGGVGAPEFRTFVGLRYAYVETDADKDGVLDFEDQCPEDEEDIDGFQDADGCADQDNDNDGVPDIEDQCAQIAGLPEDNGCPVDEEEPAEPQGIEPQEMQPDEAEPPAGAGADADGDADADGIGDADDSCPNEPGLQTRDGCPADDQKATLEDGRIEIAEDIVFERDKALIKSESYELLQQVGLIIRTNPDIETVEIAAYSSAQGKPDTYNKRLSQARAEAVRDFLVEGANVSEDRLVAKGYGAGAEGDSIEFRLVEPDEANAE